MRLLLCCALLSAGLGLAIAQEPVGICALDGFDLNDLYFGTLWNFTIEENPKVNCIHEIADDDVVGCTVFFSICKPLPKHLCSNASTNVSVCQVVTDTNGTEYHYDIGNYSTKHSFIALSNGFSAIRQGKEYPEEKMCNTSALSTILNFECDADAKYDTSQPDITQYVSSATRVPTTPCFSVYNLNYSGACYVQPTLAPTHCSLEGFDTKTISEREYWTADVPTSACIEISFTCKFVFAFCHPLPLNLSEHCRNPESAICQTDKLIEATNSWSMGAYENYTRFYENVDTDQVGFHVSYIKGSNPGDPNCTDGLNTRVIFVCNKSAVWTNEDVNSYTHVEHDHGSCNYVVVMQYSGACRSFTPVNNLSSEKTSFVGWILIGIFLFAVAVYLIVGMSFQYFVRGEQGIRIIPNFDFWRSFIILVLEGCKFSLDFITCNRFDGLPRARTKVEYDQI